METIPQAIDQWFATLRRKGCSKKTTSRYAAALVGVPDELDIDAISAWLDARREELTHNGYGYIVRSIRQLCKFTYRRTKDPAWNECYEAFDPVRLHDTDIHVPTLAHVQAQIETAMLGTEAWRDATVLLLLADLGLRGGEITALTWDDLEFDNGRIHVGEKHGHRRVLPIRASQRLLHVLLRRRKQYQQQIKDRVGRRELPAPAPHYVAGSWFYQRPEYKMIQRVVQKAADASGTPLIRPHLWRYAFLNRLLEAADIPISDIMYTMGWKSLSTFTRYLRQGGIQADRAFRTIEATPLPHTTMPFLGAADIP
jgi:integrase